MITASVMKELNMPVFEHSHSNFQNTDPDDPILATVNSYGKHPSIERINRSCNSTFSLTK